MPRLPHVSGTEAVRALEHLGFVVLRQKGSHIVVRRGHPGCVVPNHREIKIGTLSGVLKQAGVDVEEFIEALRKQTQFLSFDRTSRQIPLYSASALGKASAVQRFPIDYPTPAIRKNCCGARHP